MFIGVGAPQGWLDAAAGRFLRGFRARARDAEVQTKFSADTRPAWPRAAGRRCEPGGGGQDPMCRVIATLGQGGGARAARAPPQAFQSNSATETGQWPKTPFRFAFRAFRPPLGLSGFDGRPRHGAVLRDFQRNSEQVGTRNLATTRFRFRDALDSRELLPHAQSGHLAEPIRAPQPPDCPPKCGARGA